MRTDGIYREKDHLSFVAGGESFVVKPLDWENDFPEIERHYAEKMLTPVEALMKEFEKASASPALQEKLVQLAYRDMRLAKDVDKPTREEVARWLDTRDGLNFSFCLQLRKQYKDMTPERAVEIVGRALAGEVARRGVQQLDSLRLLQDARDESSPELVAIAKDAAAAKTPAEKIAALNQNGVTPGKLVEVAVRAGEGPAKVPVEQKT